MATNTSKTAKVIFSIILACIIILLVILLILHLIDANKLGKLAGNVAKDEKVQSLKEIADETSKKVEDLKILDTKASELKNEISDAQTTITATQNVSSEKIQNKINELANKYNDLNKEIEGDVAKESTLNTKANEETVIKLSNSLYASLEDARVSLEDMIANLELNIKLYTADVVSDATNSININVVSARDSINLNIENARNNINTNVADARNKINTNIADARNKINTNIADARNKINTNVADARNSINTNIADSRNKINTNIADSRNKINTNIADSRNKINTNIADARNKINSKLALGFEDLKKEHATITTSINDLTTSINDLSTEVGKYNTGLNANTTALEKLIGDNKNVTLTTMNGYLNGINQNVDKITKLIGVSTDSEDTSGTTVFSKLNAINSKVVDTNTKVNQMYQEVIRQYSIDGQKRGELLNILRRYKTEDGGFNEYYLYWDITQWLQSELNVRITN